MEVEVRGCPVRAGHRAGLVMAVCQLAQSPGARPPAAPDFGREFQEQNRVVIVVLHYSLRTGRKNTALRLEVRLLAVAFA